MTKVRVMTWNNQGGLADGGRFAIDEQAAFLEAQAPDIVMLQEVQDALSNKAHGVEQIEILAQATGLLHHEFWMVEDFRGMRTGIALLSRWPLTDVERTPVPRPWFNAFWPNYQGPRGILSANVVIDGQTWRIRSTHVTFHVGSQHMANHLRLLGEQAAQTPADVWPVLGGDFNTGQDDPMSAGLLETMTVVAGETIDLVWVGKSAACTPTGAGTVSCNGLSDHDPVLVTLERTVAAQPPPPPQPPPQPQPQPQPQPAGRLAVQFAPSPLRLPARAPTPGTVKGSVRVAVTAADAATGAAKAGTVRIDATGVGGAATTAPTGQQVTIPYVSKMTVDPTTRDREVTVTMARATVTVAGYRDETIDWGL